MSHDFAQMKLGKRPVLTSRLMAVPQFPDYTAKLPAPPAACSWSEKVRDYGPMLNTDLGDCTCAAAGHMVQTWTAANGAEVVPSDSDVLAMYEAVGGYVPGDESTDNGCVILDVLRHWHVTGLGGRKLEAYARIRGGNRKAARQAIAMFGGIYLGVELPLAWQDAKVWGIGRGREWTPGSWGGHAICSADYNEDGLTVITWGERVPMTWAAWERYCSETYVLLDDVWADSDKAPNGFDFDQLSTDLGYFHARPTVAEAV